MRKAFFVLLLSSTVILIGPQYAIQRQRNDFIIQNADNSNTLSMKASPALNTLIAHIVDRFVIQSATKSQYYDLTPVPTELLTLISQVDERFVILSAHENERYSFSYPLSLIGDDNPPKASKPTVTASSTNGLKITWTTNEYTRSIIKYGIRPEVYTQNVRDDLYEKKHQILLRRLTSGKTYYYRIRDTDRSGNTSQSQEYRFTVQTPP